MLVLSRHRFESIVIQSGQDLIEVSVVAVRDTGKVRLGVNAPEHVKVDRREVYEAKMGMNSTHLKVAAEKRRPAWRGKAGCADSAQEQPLTTPQVG